ncbi:MAG TPA: SDR family NAD(P)-dependent oxidoreductase [Polyangiaceae bacterium]|nr:SDR family NAD(P)-dependent oxidoreductase [Polyangiaceae bacterium]
MSVLSDQTCLVIGGGRGIGRAVSLLFAREGAKVMVADTGVDLDGSGGDPGVAKAVVEEIRSAGGVAESSAEDATLAGGAERLVKACTDAWGRLDALVYAAGIVVDRSLVRADEESFDRVVRTHLGGSFHATRAAAAVMARAGKGRIVLTTSTAGLLGNFGQVAYSAAAAGVYGLLRAASIELQRNRVFVNGVAPLAKTRATEKLPLFETVDTMTPEHAAAPYLFFASELSGEATGNVLGVAGGRLSAWKLGESSGKFKEADGGVWTATEIQGAFETFSRL